MATASEVLDRLDAAHATAASALLELSHATKAASALARELARGTEAKLADDDEWTRLPNASGRCTVSNWSRSTILRKSVSSTQRAPGKIRTKHIGTSRFYSAADVRRLLSSP